MTFKVAKIMKNKELSEIQAYMPYNYTAFEREGEIFVVGNDVAGWTMRDYVIPRLSSGLIGAIELEEWDMAVSPVMSWIG